MNLEIMLNFVHINDKQWIQQQIIIVKINKDKT